jgi:hypothetical protein
MDATFRPPPDRVAYFLYGLQIELKKKPCQTAQGKRPESLPSLEIDHALPCATDRRVGEKGPSWSESMNGTQGIPSSEREETDWIERERKAEQSESRRRAGEESRHRKA